MLSLSWALRVVERYVYILNHIVLLTLLFCTQIKLWDSMHISLTWEGDPYAGPNGDPIRSALR